jgi:hypothetical protein
MVNNDDPTGKNVRLDDDDFVINPNKMKKKSAPEPVPAAPSYSSYTPPAAAPTVDAGWGAAPTPPPAPATFVPPPAPVTMASTGTTTNTNSTQTTVNTSDLAALAGNSQPSVIEEHWAKSFWRPAMGWLYMIICFMDFVGFPLLTIFLPIIFKPFGLVMPYQAWTSLTLSNGGLIHLAFGAILGVSAFSRGQEKIAQR